MCIKCMKVMVKYFFSRLSFWEVILDLDTYIFPWQMCFGVCLILKSSCIQANKLQMLTLPTAQFPYHEVLYLIHNLSTCTRPFAILFFQ